MRDIQKLAACYIAEEGAGDEVAQSNFEADHQCRYSAVQHRRMAPRLPGSIESHNCSDGRDQESEPTYRHKYSAKCADEALASGGDGKDDIRGLSRPINLVVQPWIPTHRPLNGRRRNRVDDVTEKDWNLLMNAPGAEDRNDNHPEGDLDAEDDIGGA